jgi:hypothetical protein
VVASNTLRDDSSTDRIGSPGPGAGPPSSPWRAACAASGAPAYFTIEKLTAFEIDEIPSGAVGLKVTNAVWMRKPTNTGHGGS